MFLLKYGKKNIIMINGVVGNRTKTLDIDNYHRNIVRFALLAFCNVPRAHRTRARVDE